VTRVELAHTLYTPELSLIAKKLRVTIQQRLSARAGIDLPAGPVVASAIIARSIISAIVARPTIIVGPRTVGAVIVTAVVGLIVARAEVIEKERERERNTPTHALGSGRELRENQCAASEQKNQQLIHMV
jgi:hypothetical protein